MNICDYSRNIGSRVTVAGCIVIMLASCQVPNDSSLVGIWELDTRSSEFDKPELVNPVPTGIKRILLNKDHTYDFLGLGDNGTWKLNNSRVTLILPQHIKFIEQITGDGSEINLEYRDNLLTWSTLPGKTGKINRYAYRKVQ